MIRMLLQTAPPKKTKAEEREKMSYLNLALQERQWEAFKTNATEVLYGGSAGSGKSHLMRTAAIAWCSAIPNLQVYLFRRTSPELKTNHMVGSSGFISLLTDLVKEKGAKINLSNNEISFWNGSKIHLCHCQYEKDVYRFQGAEINVLMLDEATHFTPFMYRYLRGRTRLGGLEVPEQYKKCFPRILCGSNPGGISHNFFKKMFVSPRPPMVTEQMPDDEGGMFRQYIPAKLTDNKVLLKNDPSYAARLRGLGNDSLIKAMLEGNWDIISGGAFDDVWNSDEHVIEPFPIPKSWYIDRSFDWGSAKPFSVLWFAEADGTEVQEGYMKGWCPPRGTLVVIGEWYGCTSEANTGLRLSAKEIARGILSRERDMQESFLSWKNARDRRQAINIYGGPADNQIFQESNENCIATDMENEGVYWTHSNKSPGTRVTGLEIIRARLKNGLQDYVESPAMYIFNTCRNLMEHLPVLPRDINKPEDVDTNAEDHDYDALRYRCLGTEQRPVNLKVEFVT
jgi:hypothetical protein